MEKCPKHDVSVTLKANGPENHNQYLHKSEDPMTQISWGIG